MNRIEKILQMLETDGNDSFLLHALALEYIKIGREEDALQAFINLLKNNPDYVGSYYHLGKLYEKNGQIEKAIETYEIGMAVAKKCSDNHSFNELMMAKDELE